WPALMRFGYAEATGAGRPRFPAHHVTAIGECAFMSDILARFDLDNPELPEPIRRDALGSGGYPYDDRMDKGDYKDRLVDLQKQLVRLQAHLQKSGERVAVVFEGRDAAGKGGTIRRYMAHLNPRLNRVAALPKPSDREQ